MNKFLSFLLAILCLTSVSAQVSNADKLMYRGGLMLETYTAVSDSFNANTFDQSYRALAFETYYILGQKNDIVSGGVIGGVAASFRPLGQDLGKFRSNYHVGIPVYAAMRLGAQSTPYNRQKIGVGAGLGAMLVTASSYYANGGASSYAMKLNYVTPQAMAEIILNMRAAMLTLRLHLSPVVTKVNTVQVLSTGEKINYPSTVANFGFGVVYSF